MKPIMFPNVVPWRNPEQFCKVYKCLYSNSISDRRWAVDQISVWETRCHPALPTAVEATVALVRAVIQDLLFQVEKSFCQASDIQMLYSMALVRFVNLTLEVDQTTPNTVNRGQLAEKRNIPGWIVDLRHQSAHSFCPSLPVLRMGALTALEYLENTFWKVEAANISLIVSNPPVAEQEIQALIIQYKSIQHARRLKKGRICALRNDLSVVMKKLRRHLENSKELVIKCLLKPDVFISREDMVKILDHAVSVYMELEINLPQMIEKFWIPMIRLLHSFDLIPLFLEKLMLGQERCNIPICNKLSSAWAMRLLLATSPYSSTSVMDHFFKEKGVLFNYHRLLYACMRGANKYFLTVFEMISGKLDNSRRFDQMLCVFCLNQGWLIDEKSVEPRRLGPRPASKRARDAAMQEIVFTLEDVEDDLSELKARRKRMRRDDSTWLLAPVGLKWTEIPLGTILNPANEAEDKDAPSKVERQVDISDEPTSYIISNESDNEELTAEEMVTSDSRETYIIPEMVYRRRQKN